MSYWQIYLLTRLEPLGTLIFVLGLLAALAIPAAIFLHVLISDFNGKDAAGRVFEKTKTAFLPLGVASVALFLIHALMPNNKDVATIVAGRWATNNQDVGQIPDDAVKLLRNFLDDKLKKDTEKKP